MKPARAPLVNVANSKLASPPTAAVKTASLLASGSHGAQPSPTFDGFLRGEFSSGEFQNSADAKKSLKKLRDEIRRAYEEDEAQMKYSLALVASLGPQIVELQERRDDLHRHIARLRCGIDSVAKERELPAALSRDKDLVREISEKQQTLASLISATQDSRSDSSDSDSSLDESSMSASEGYNSVNIFASSDDTNDLIDTLSSAALAAADRQDATAAGAGPPAPGALLRPSMADEADGLADESADSVDLDAIVGSPMRPAAAPAQRLDGASPSSGSGAPLPSAASASPLERMVVKKLLATPMRDSPMEYVRLMSIEEIRDAGADGRSPVAGLRDVSQRRRSVGQLIDKWHRRCELAQSMAEEPGESPPPEGAPGPPLTPADAPETRKDAPRAAEMNGGAPEGAVKAAAAVLEARAADRSAAPAPAAPEGAAGGPGGMKMAAGAAEEGASGADEASAAPEGAAGEPQRADAVAVAVADASTAAYESGASAEGGAEAAVEESAEAAVEERSAASFADSGAASADVSAAVEDIGAEIAEDICAEIAEKIGAESVEDTVAESVEDTVAESVEDIAAESVEDIVAESAEDIVAECAEDIARGKC